jgi:O-antigen/teichoic acid export membrane protein
MNSGISLKINVVANFLGSFGAAIISFIFIPQYIKYLGAESFGLIGFYITMAGVLAILDFGIGASVSREMPKFRISDEEKKNTIVLLKSFEILSFIVGGIIAGSVFLLAPLITEFWLNKNALDEYTIRNSIILMGLIIAVKWPNSIYTACLNGLEKQIQVNLINFLSSLISSVGVLFVLIYYKANIVNYFLWQLIVAIIFTYLSHFMVWKNVEFEGFKGYFDKSALLSVKKFAIGIGMTALLSAMFTQIDKIILSKLLSLELFGYYTIAAAISSTLFKFIYPISQAISPRLVYLIHENNENKIAEFYQKSSQIIAAIIVPIGICLAFFSKEIIFLWSQNSELTNNVFPIATILILGTTINGLINVPYALQVAYGYTKIIFFQNLIATILLIPLLFVLTKKFGVLGAASVWLILNIGYVTISQIILHSKYLINQRNYWFINSVFKPLLIVSSIALLGRNIINLVSNDYLVYLIILITLFTSFVFTVFTLKYPKLLALETIKKIKSHEV